MSDWTPPALPPGVPLYRAIADAMAADIASGALKPGTRLPTHRALADAVGVDLTTITRAYADARQRGLVEASVGRGTFVADAARQPPPPPVELDLSMNLPPQPPSANLAARLARTMAGLTRRPDLSRLLNYQPNGGSEADRKAGAKWLGSRIPDLDPARVLVTGGAQSCLTALLTLETCWAGDILSDPYAYTGFRLAAQMRGLHVTPVQTDALGMVAPSLALVARDTRARLVYLTPTIHNPTTLTMPLERRLEIAAVARAQNLIIIEDDAYGMLAEPGLPPLAALAPERVWHIATLSKCLSPGLRVAYLVAPQGTDTNPIRAALRATSQMAMPLSVAAITGWIEDGTASEILAAIRQEAVERQAIARRLLPMGAMAAHPQGHHVWLTLPPYWTDRAFALAAKKAGATVVPGSNFAMAAEPPEKYVRVALGAAPDQPALAHALEKLAALMRHGPVSEVEVV
ncbi:PLP-dependent aminotransferase family protein [Niveispirillum sp. KHB5.9]|uniref:aminotransferase-like domain-containing protein n=1 Tax=Niveispirillum sp. KHB5.9 TaxID=3400269 RepID=UPI003A837766